MAGWSGGVFTRARNWVTDKAGAINPQATLFDQEDDNFATGLNNCVTKDGANKPSATMDWNTQRLTNMGAATARTDALQAAQEQDGSVTSIAAVAGTDTITGTLTPAIAAYATGQKFSFKPANTNTGAATINVNGVGAKSIVKFGAAALVAGDLVANSTAFIIYDGASFQLLNPIKILDSSLSSNVAIVTAANTFTASPQSISAATPQLSLRATGAGADAKNFLVRLGSSGNFALSTAADATPTTAAVDAVVITRSATAVSDIAASATTLSLTGNLVTPNTSASEVGFKGMPQNAIADNYTLVLTDAGKHVKLNVSAKTITIPANASVAFPIGTVIRLSNINSGGSITIAITSDQLLLVGSGSSGSRTLTDWGMATIEKVTSTAWMIQGVGLS